MGVSNAEGTLIGSFPVGAERIPDSEYCRESRPLGGLIPRCEGQMHCHAAYGATRTGRVAVGERTEMPNAE